MAYERVNWENLPSTNTPVNADNLNKMDKGIRDLENNKINSSYLTNFTDGIARKRRVSNADFNSLATFQSGLITIIGATANAPVKRDSNSHWYVLQIYTKEGGYEFITQIATFFFDYNDSNIYIRKCIKGTWGAWRKIATSAV